MSYADERRGYDSGHADGTRMIGTVHCAATAEALQHKLVVSRLVAQVNTAYAVNQDMQARIQAAEEYVRFMDRSNGDLCTQIQDLGTEIQEMVAKLQAWEAYGKTSQATMARQRQEIEDQREKIGIQERIMQQLSDNLAREYGF